VAARAKAAGVLSGAFPLVETHLHLEGSIPRRVLASLASRAGLRLPDRVPGPGRGLQRRRGFGPFLDAFVFSASLLRDARDFDAAAYALLEDLRIEGILYAEIYFSPQVHLRRGVPLTSIMRGLGDARRRARAEGGPEVGFIADGGRLWGPEWFEEIVEQVARHRGEGVVAVGIGGDEAAAPARVFRRGFERARKAGLGVVAHAGEGTSARNVAEVIDHLGVTRIGHGISAASDRRLLRRLADRGICLEICPTSNVMTGAASSFERHPLREILDAGVPVALGSDDRSIFGATLRGEIDLAVRRMGVPVAAIPGLLGNAARSAFTSGRWRRDFETALAAAPARGRWLERASRA